MAETIEDLDVVTLVRDLPEEGLPAGQAGTVVFVHDGGAAFEVEFMISPRHSVVATVDRDHLLKLKGLNFSKAAV
jgi:hypothetical protein